MQKKIIISALLSVIVILLGLGIISNLSINASIRNSLAERTELAGILASYTDYLLQNNLTRLYDISLSGAVDLRDGDWEPETRALKTAFQYSIFTDGIFLLDVKGNIVITYPSGSMKRRNLMGIPYVRKTLEEKRAIVSNIYTDDRTNRKGLFVLVPLRDRGGEVIGAVGGEINPTNYILNNIIRTIPANSETIIELVDSFGVVIASNRAGRIFECSDRDRVLGNLIASRKKAVMACHRCHEGEGGPAKSGMEKTTDMLAFAPLSEAPWGVSIREPEKHVFAPSSALKKKFLILGCISVGSALLLALGISRSIVNPIRTLTNATKRITKGNLDEPVTIVSKDEIGILSESFELMRLELSDSLGKVQKYNAELEARVVARTDELQQSRKRLAILLHEVIRAQEDERKRIARELHDETSQSIAALGMSIEIAAIALRENDLAPENIQELRGKVTHLLEGISRIIQDLRPPVLDDLGLESAVRWLIEKHLLEKGVRCQLRASEDFSRLASEVREEKTVLTVFRIIQETIINVSKHARATAVTIDLSCKDNNLMVEVQDDGIGFDVRNVLRSADTGAKSGFGIMGLRERVALLDGTIRIHSTVGEGTRVSIAIPCSFIEETDV